jgi:hypothetical protein
MATPVLWGEHMKIGRRLKDPNFYFRIKPVTRFHNFEERNTSSILEGFLMKNDICKNIAIFINFVASLN